MSIPHILARSALAAALALPLLLAGCTAPQKRPAGAPADDASVGSNEPDLVAQLRQRMASGKLQRREKAATGPTASGRDTSSAPTVTVNPEKQLAAQAVGADYARALILMKQGSDAEAAALLTQISRRTPEFSGPLVNLAVLLLKQGKFAEAERQLRDALAINPKNPYARNLLGITLREQGKFQDARAAYEAALALDPNYAKAHFNLGVLADLYIQDLPTALGHYERYQSLQSKPDPAVANWIIDLQKRSGVYKAPARPAAPVVAAPEPEEAAADAGAATETPATGEAPATAPAPAPDATAQQKQKAAS
ncbi:MAG: tetratricopeptide repeat protein [Pseudomonadota bacterium]